MPPSRAAPSPLPSSPSAPRVTRGEAGAQPVTEVERQHELPIGVRAASLLSGVPGSGKTKRLIARVVELLREGVAPESLLVLAPSPRAAIVLAARLRADLGDRSGEGEPVVSSAAAFCERLLRSEALAAGLDPFFVLANRADRLAMLLGTAREASGGALRARPRGSAPRTPASALRAIERIDRLKEALVDAERYSSWAQAQQADAEHPAHAFAALYAEHELMLAAREALDAGDLPVRAAALVKDDTGVRGRLAARFGHVFFDDFEDVGPALGALVEVLAQSVSNMTLVGDRQWLGTFARAHPDATSVELRESVRCGPRLLDAANAALGRPAPEEPEPAAPEQIAFWRCADERARAEVIVAEIERLVAAAGASAAPSIGVLVSSLARDGRALVGALKERAIPYRLACASELFERAEVRDLLAWMRLLSDPLDRNAAIRLLTRPPVELRPVDLARVVQLSRRRKLDMLPALAAALEAPQLPPEARERISTFLAIYDELAAALAELRPEELLHRVIDRAGLRRERLLGEGDGATEGLVSLSRIQELAAHSAQFEPQGDARSFAAYLSAASVAGLTLEDLASEGAETRAADNGAAVEVLTFEHGRGHEFDHVFLVGIDDSAGSRGTTETEPGTGGDHLLAPLLAHAGGADAERRLLYIAMTRARERVVLVHTARAADRSPQGPIAAAEDARRAVSAQWEDHAPEPRSSSEALQSAIRALRRHVLEDVTRIGGRLGELRLDTGEDISHGVVRYLQLIKLAALLERSNEQSLADALPDINARLLAASTPLERELLESSELDATLIAESSRAAGGMQGAAARESITEAALGGSASAPEDARLVSFLPRHGAGLMLSASDIASYRACPLRYKFARVLRIPSEQTPQQRFGIMVHKVLERYHSESEGTPARGADDHTALMRLLDAAWRRAGFRESPGELALLETARAALTRYQQQLADQPGRPVWFERSFSFPVGPHLVRGRVDRVDRIPDGDYELIDYKTSHARSAAQLEGDIQLALYALAARRAWDVTAERLAYYYVLDNRKVPLTVAQDSPSLQRVTDTITDVADSIRALKFEPTPSYEVCSACDFLSICPAAEA